jgi:hypothetical protein
MLQVHYNIIDEAKISASYTGSNNFFDDPELIPGSYYFTSLEPPGLDMGIVKLNVFNHDFECPPEDIDGIPRPQSGASEIGAVELLFASIPESFNENLQVSISPNPLYQSTTISFRSEGNQDNYLGVFDIAGNKVIDEVIPCSGKSHCEYILDGSGLTPGIYLVRIINGRSTGTSKLVVTR